jgi:hypothetical protein
LGGFCTGFPVSFLGWMAGRRFGAAAGVAARRRLPARRATYSRGGNVSGATTSRGLRHVVPCGVGRSDVPCPVRPIQAQFSIASCGLAVAGALLGSAGIMDDDCARNSGPWLVRPPYMHVALHGWMNCTMCLYWECKIPTRGLLLSSPCLDAPKNLKVYKITHHIESLDVYMQH